MRNYLLHEGEAICETPSQDAADMLGATELRSLPLGHYWPRCRACRAAAAEPIHAIIHGAAMGGA